MSVMKFEKVLTAGSFVFTSGNGNAIVRVTPSVGTRSTYTVKDNIAGGITGDINVAQDIMLGNTDNIEITVTAGSVVISSQAGIA